MKLDRMNDRNQFFITDISFSQLKNPAPARPCARGISPSWLNIKDACRIYARQGSSVAEGIARELEELMGKIEI